MSEIGSNDSITDIFRKGNKQKSAQSEARLLLLTLELSTS